MSCGEVDHSLLGVKLVSLKQREVVLHVKERQILELLAKECWECEKGTQEEAGLHCREVPWVFLQFRYAAGAWAVPWADSSWGLGGCWWELSYMLALFLPFPGYVLVASVGEQ